MLHQNRVIFSDNGVLSDLSSPQSDVFAGNSTLAVKAAQDALYIGSDLPFNHRFLKVSTANDVASVMSVSLWDGSAWVPALDVIDGSSVAGVTLAQSGILSWVPDRDESWNKEDTTYGIVTGLTTLKIYDLYWAKIVFSANLKATTALAYVGQRFSSDAQLAGRYPDLADSTTISNFTSGKTAWDEQHVLAAEEIVRDLRKQNTIWSKNQVLDWEVFADAAVQKTAQIIYTAQGEAYAEQRDEARREYDRAMSRLHFGVDRNNDARLESSEKANVTRYRRV